jgi:hypothetical protein
MIFEKVMTAVPDEPEERTSDPSPDVGPSDRRGAPVPPVQSQEDTDIGWGERHESEDDEHLYRERPPHWDAL